MPSERVQRRIDKLLDQAEEFADAQDWGSVRDTALSVLAVSSGNEDAKSFLAMAKPHLSELPDVEDPAEKLPDAAVTKTPDSPSSFADGRYTVKRLLGEGGKKLVYLAHDATLDRDIAFAVIKTDGLDDIGRERILREAQAMGRMGTHPCIMPIYDLGEEDGNPYMVQPLMSGGDVEELVEDADGALPLEQAIQIATQTAEGLVFAHSKGIIHRDLKPGNVWLDEDGAAKIGDFGLAIATDRSRLTVEKLMVGTVNYMPPEQATGGEVTSRADLYSLGAMLYEMSTGRVPFMGDDDIGVISQHVNTPPVAPSWHNPSIPKTLDSLIVRLMSKDPSERPQTAEEVLDALGAVDLFAVEDSEDAGKGSLDAMAGGVFVGRQREMDNLKSIFEEVLAGKGRMVTLVGEPGIGKTRTAQELATYASMRGAQVLWGRSYESGGAPPYWPWVQAIRSHVASTEPDMLRDQMGSAAPIIAEIIADVREKLSDLSDAPKIDDPESARFRLFDSIATFLKNASSDTPIVLMLEDLHWSDKPSLMLLEFVARELANAKIMIVGNYRDMELNRRHPLSISLGDLSRERLFERILLRGLQKHDVERFIEIAAGISPPPALVDAVHTQTEGNPLFVTETVRLLIQEGDITAGRTTHGGTTSWEIRIPEGVREVIGRRLDRLSERCNNLLTVAAVIGRQFKFGVLKELVEDTTEGQLLDALDEALSARIVEEMPEEIGLYQFTHAQMQETLTGELSANRTVRMHARIAEALEAHYGDEAQKHAEELVPHFVEAETVIGTDGLIRYSRVAGHRALLAFGYEATIEHLSRVLGLLNGSTVDAEQAHDWVTLSRAQLATLASREWHQAISSLDKGVSYFVKEKMVDEAYSAVQVDLRNQIGRDTGMSDVAESVLSLLPKGTIQYANVQAIYAQAIARERGRVDEALELLDESISFAQSTLDSRLLMRSLAYKSLAYLQIARSTESLQLGLAALELSDEIGDPSLEAFVRFYVAQSALWSGEPDIALANITRVDQIARSLRNRNLQGDAHFIHRMYLEARGEWAAADTAHARMVEAIPNATRVFLYGFPDIERGIFEQASNSIRLLHDEISRSAGSTIRMYWMAIFNFQLKMEELSGATVSSDELQSAHEHWVGLVDDVMTGTTASIQRAIFAGSPITSDIDESIVADFLEGPVLKQTLIPHGVGMSTPRIRGRLLRKIGDIEGATLEFETAREFAGRCEYRPELAHTDHDYAQMLLDRDAPGDSEKATELQDEAIAIATELDMKPLLERVLAQREILKA
jgi:eukaryotic-like serine/threonine-protein kinase